MVAGALALALTRSWMVVVQMAPDPKPDADKLSLRQDREDHRVPVLCP